MKKMTIGSALVLALLVLDSCTKVSSPTTIEYTIQNGEWTSSGNSGSSNYIYYNDHSVAEITDDVINSGAVLGYVKTGSYWAALPFTETYTGYVVNYNYAYTAGEVIIIRKDSDLMTIPPGGSVTVKLVILTTKQMELVAGVDTDNYYEVSEVLNLD